MAVWGSTYAGRSVGVSMCFDWGLWFGPEREILEKVRGNTLLR